MKFGTLYAYWTHDWEADYFFIADKCKKAGFDVMEIGGGHLLDMSDAEIEKLRDYCRDLGLEISCNIGPPKNCDVSSSDPAKRAAGVDWVVGILRQMVKIGSKVLIGAFYNCWPNTEIDGSKEAMWERSVNEMKKIASVADELGIMLCLEILNRFESPILNDCEEGIRYCKEVGHPSCKLLLDTFHMNIEEDDLPGAIRKAGDLLGHVHVGEGNRKLPGMGHLPWAEMGEALREIGFDGCVVMEPFMKRGGAVERDIKVYRDLSGNADEETMDKYIADSLVFLRRNFAG
ncbi:MAG: sugar phosphate isomerase/epimerase [Clostridia bacterium]|nr:sugar phosphate isomerase/epimerase [Clostridia bacterium]